MHQENQCRRAKHAGEIDEGTCRGTDLFLNNSSDPQKNERVHDKVQPVEMKKRLSSDAPVLSVQLAVIWKRAKFEQCRIISDATGDELDAENNCQCGDEHKPHRGDFHCAAVSPDNSRLLSTRHWPRGKSPRRRFPIRVRTSRLTL